MKLLRACLVIFLCTSFALEMANLTVALSLLTVLFPRMIPSAVAQWLCFRANAFVRVPLASLSQNDTFSSHPMAVGWVGSA